VRILSATVTDYRRVAARYRKRTETPDTAPTRVEWADLPETAAALLIGRPDSDDCVLVLHRGLTAPQAQIAALVALTRGRLVKYVHAEQATKLAWNGVTYPDPIVGDEGSESEVLSVVMLDEVLRRETELGGMPRTDTPPTS
jgi:hypothetical protein